MNDAAHNDAGAWRSGKGHRDENFPVASWLIHPRHRGIVLSFYDFVRTADDIADHATMPPDQKLALLDRLDAGLVGQNDADGAAVRLRKDLAERNLGPKHAQDLLAAFKLDVTKLRYRDWDDLIAYCSLSAMPVGRFVLDVHGESSSTWPANDALCAALQINNHLQDCGKDFRNLNRVYVPRDALEAAGASVEMLAAGTASPALLQCLHGLAARNQRLLQQSKSFSAEVKDFRLGLEISVIYAFAERIVHLLQARDPLSQRVHLSPLELLFQSLAGMAGEAARRAVGRRAVSKAAAGR
jgi:squalene synthase HpnC